MVALLLGVVFDSCTKASAEKLKDVKSSSDSELIFDPVTGLCGHVTVKTGKLD